ncbi:MAG: urease accessory protein UreE [Betaproteobacteria bacterium]|nr:urease accessory protein UreE [Betaproteobacteria bacterium]
MLTLSERCPPAGAPYGTLVLPYDGRSRSRLRVRLASGEEVALFLPRGTVLADGDHLRGEDGRVVRVVAAAEQVYRVECHDAVQFARCAFHLGNRHTPVQLLGAAGGHHTLRILEDPVLKAMLEGLGAHVEREMAPFQPEAGAYGGGHHHHDDAAHHPRIHRAAGPGHRHD